jgi:pimeloyl-ACP methyl ester carboxylesterase
VAHDYGLRMPVARSARILLVHGAATSATVWDRLLPHLAEYDVVAVERPRTGDLDRELARLIPPAENAFVVGMSGGATLGLGLAMSGVRLAGAVLHEPAVGSLLPELLTPMAAAFEAGGTAGFGRALYGPTWTLDLAGGQDDCVTARELAMFRTFEPGPASAYAGPVVVTVGEASPPIRHEAARALERECGYPSTVLAGCGHFVAHDHPEALAEVVRRGLAASG